jgi:hypothetical protein
LHALEKQRACCSCYSAGAPQRSELAPLVTCRPEPGRRKDLNRSWKDAHKTVSGDEIMAG